jgi:hypothetical protein
VTAALEAAPTPTTWDAKLALWINAYNILAIDTVLQHYPLESIRDLGSWLTPVWRHDAGTVAGELVSLHRIEHQILRRMEDPRIHAAVVCASTSCPSLWREPYRAGDIQRQLEGAMLHWLADPQKGMRIDRSEEEIYLSKIFDWFEWDWDEIGGVRAVLQRYAPPDHRDWLERHGEDADLEYFEYDWSLNDTPETAR